MTLRTRVPAVILCLAVLPVACSQQAPSLGQALPPGNSRASASAPTAAAPYEGESPYADREVDTAYEESWAPAPTQEPRAKSAADEDDGASWPAGRGAPQTSREESPLAERSTSSYPPADRGDDPGRATDLDLPPGVSTPGIDPLGGMPRWDDELRRPHEPRFVPASNGPQPFLDPRSQPYSTFSTDVDTASYTIARSRIRAGTLPGPELVRVEEFLNYFAYDMDAATREGPIAVSTEVGPCPWSTTTRLVRVNVSAQSAPWSAQPPRNFVFLVDVSGSMNSRDKLPLLRQGLTDLVQTLDRDDTISIVAYAGASGVVLPPTAGNHRATIRRSLRRLHASGSTNGAAGIELAYELARRSFIPGGVNRVILATDGDFNVGLQDPTMLEHLIERERESGVFLTVLGFGQSGMRDDTMESLADHGNGNYAFIDSAEEAERVLVHEGGATLHTAAKDVKLQVEFNPAMVRAYRLVGYDNRRLADRDFNDDRKDAGDLGDGDHVTALYEVVLAQPYSPAVDTPRYHQSSRPAPHDPGHYPAGAEMMHVKLRYKDPQATSSRRLDHIAYDDGRGWSQVSADFQFAAAVAGFALRLRGDADIAHWHLGSIANLAELATSATKTRQHRREREAFVELVRDTERLALRW